SPDGKTVSLGAGPGRRAQGDPAIHLWDVASGDEVRRMEGPAPAAAAERRRFGTSPYDSLGFAPDGRSLAIVADQRVLRWEVANGKERCLIGVLPPLYSRRDGPANGAPSLAFSPDGRTLAVGCGDGAVRLWDVHTGHQLPPLVGHEGGVRAVQF